MPSLLKPLRFLWVLAGHIRWGRTAALCHVGKAQNALIHTVKIHACDISNHDDVIGYLSVSVCTAYV